MLDLRATSAADLVNLLASGFADVSFSQEGEDKILSRLFGGQQNGFYVDVGAHHPLRFSNTAGLYFRGWRGINVDATPGSMAPFAQIRPRDVNLECCVSEDGADVVFDLYNEPALNSTRCERAATMPEHYKVVQRKIMPSRRLDDILAEHMPANTPLDLLSVDVEGADLDVLRSHDWTHHRPRVLVVEDGDFDVENPGASPMHPFLREKGMRWYAKLYRSLIYVAPDAF